MDTQQVEKNIQIAERVPPGDRWKLLNGEKVYDSLTEVLNAWYQQATVKPPIPFPRHRTSSLINNRHPWRRDLGGVWTGGHD